MKRASPEEAAESNPLYDEPRARRSDPHTSHAAAAKVDRDVVSTIRGRVLHVLRTRGPSTHEEVLDVFEENGWEASPSGVRTRCVELLNAGHVRDTGNVRPTRFGRDAIVWAATH